MTRHTFIDINISTYVPVPLYAFVCIYTDLYILHRVLCINIHPPIRRPDPSASPFVRQPCGHIGQVCGVYVEVLLAQPSAPLPDVPALLDGLFALISTYARAIVHTHSHSH